MFLAERGMLTRTADSSLPSLYEACHEDPYRPGGAGFASWPATKWPWFGELARIPGAHLFKVHRGKNILFSDQTFAFVGPICRAELVRMESADPDWCRLLGHLSQVGPSEVADIETELGLKAKELKAIRYPLERCGAVVSRAVVRETDDGGHVHTSELARFDQVYPAGGGAGTVASGDGRSSRHPIPVPREAEAEAEEAFAELLVAAVAACLVAPEAELRRWFSWSWLAPSGLVDRLVDEGRLRRPAPRWITAVSADRPS